MAALTDCGWAVVASAGCSFFLRRANTKWLGRLSGAVLIGGGIWLSLARRPG
jgi:threonine/homoserine/homoserine lactone efflux protein